MIALTLWQPWAWCVAHAGKPVENRTWPPPDCVIGKRIAIHAGKKLDAEAVEYLRYWRKGGTMLGRQGPKITVDIPEQFALGAVVAVAKLCGWIGPCGNVAVADGVDSLVWEASAWRSDGSYAWMLDDVTALSEPVPCRGNRGLWRLPDDVEVAVLEQTARKARP